MESNRNKIRNKWTCKIVQFFIVKIQIDVNR